MLYVGIAGSDLVCQIRDGNDAAWEDNTVMLKNYVGERTKMAKVVDAASSMSTIPTTPPSVKATADLAGKRRSPPRSLKKSWRRRDLGDLTGDVVMCAHGTPASVGGRIVGVELGGKSPSQIVDLITASKDKSKRIPKSFSTKLILVGCFTASGSCLLPPTPPTNPSPPSAAAELSKRGYKNAAVVGMPGPAYVIPGQGFKDDHGEEIEQGEVESEHSGDNTALLATIQKRIDANMDKLNAAQDNWKGKPEDFDKNPKVLEVITAMKKDSTEMSKIAAASSKTKGLTGYFGPEKYKSKPWYKRLFK